MLGTELLLQLSWFTQKISLIVYLPPIIEKFMKSICVFLGANAGANPVYARAIQQLGTELAQRNITCVYGGSDTGLMKLLADSVLAAGGEVIGVTVKALHDKEIFHNGLTQLHITANMHERKSMMAELADGFITVNILR